MNPLTTLVGAKSTEVPESPPEDPPEPPDETQEPDQKRRSASTLFLCSAGADIAAFRARHID
jgi:hypothetical protein